MLFCYDIICTVVLFSNTTSQFSHYSMSVCYFIIYGETLATVSCLVLLRLTRHVYTFVHKSTFIHPLQVEQGWDICSPGNWFQRDGYSYAMFNYTSNHPLLCSRMCCNVQGKNQAFCLPLVQCLHTTFSQHYVILSGCHCLVLTSY